MNESSRPIETLIGLMNITNDAAADTLRRYDIALRVLSQAEKCYRNSVTVYGCASDQAAADLAILRDAGDKARNLLGGSRQKGMKMTPPRYDDV